MLISCDINTPPSEKHDLRAWKNIEIKQLSSDIGNNFINWFSQAVKYPELTKITIKMQFSQDQAQIITSNQHEIE